MPQPRSYGPGFAPQGKKLKRLMGPPKKFAEAQPQKRKWGLGPKPKTPTEIFQQELAKALNRQDKRP